MGAHFGYASTASSGSFRGGGHSKSRRPLGVLNANTLSMGDDDPFLERNDIRKLNLDKWEAARFGRAYLCAEALKALDF